MSFSELYAKDRPRLALVVVSSKPVNLADEYFRQRLEQLVVEHNFRRISQKVVNLK